MPASLIALLRFLMYRVELKAHLPTNGCSATLQFLMHRVELRVRQTKINQSLQVYVPNVPCGVESPFQRV